MFETSNILYVYGSVIIILQKKCKCNDWTCSVNWYNSTIYTQRLSLFFVYVASETRAKNSCDNLQKILQKLVCVKESKKIIIVLYECKTLERNLATLFSGQPESSLIAVETRTRHRKMQTATNTHYIFSLFVKIVNTFNTNYKLSSYSQIQVILRVS